MLLRLRLRLLLLLPLLLLFFAPSVPSFIFFNSSFLSSLEKIFSRSILSFFKRLLSFAFFSSICNCVCGSFVRPSPVNYFMARLALWKRLSLLVVVLVVVLLTIDASFPYDVRTCRTSPLAVCFCFKYIYLEKKRREKKGREEKRRE